MSEFLQSYGFFILIAILIFPPAATKGLVRIVVRNVGGVAERAFTWDLVR